MFETYRMLGKQREVELLREAQRLHAGRAVKDGRVLRTPGRRLVSVVRNRAVVLLISVQDSTTRADKRPLRSSARPLEADTQLGSEGGQS
jgi:hypothetical protein